MKKEKDDLVRKLKKQEDEYEEEINHLKRIPSSKRIDGGEG